MTEVIIKIPDEQVSFFMDLVNRLGYVTTLKPTNIEQVHIDIVEDRM